tara:strand:- start:32 stop:178 length:147 start_codon:yes stop_codon:yes gene_type:complete
LFIWTKIPEGEDRISIHVFGLNYGEAEIVGESIKKDIAILIPVFMFGG